jgi:hypothetical protein
MIGPVHASGRTAARLFLLTSEYIDEILASIRSFHNIYIKARPDGKIRQPKATTTPGCRDPDNKPSGGHRQNPVPAWGNTHFLAAWTENHPETMDRLSMTPGILYAACRLFLMEIQIDVCISQNTMNLGPADAGCRYLVFLSSDFPAGR